MIELLIRELEKISVSYDQSDQKFYIIHTKEKKQQFEDAKIHNPMLVKNISDFYLDISRYQSIMMNWRYIPKRIEDP